MYGRRVVLKNEALVHLTRQIQPTQKAARLICNVGQFISKDFSIYRLKMRATPTDVLKSYKSMLTRENKSGHLKKLENNEKTNPDGAKFEAAIFSILQSEGIHVEIGDDPKSGGTDFICTVKAKKFAFEATSINTFRMGEGTGLRNDQTGVSGGFYQRYPGLYQKLEGKVKQVSKTNLPGIVSIGSFHNESLTIFRDVMADEYLSAFFIRERNGNLIPNENLKAISGFILVGFGYDEYRIMGFLNPDPEYPFDIRTLPAIMFREITKKGIQEKTGEGEWNNVRRCSVGPSIPCHPLKTVL